MLSNRSHHHAPVLGVDLHHASAGVDRNHLERTGRRPPRAGWLADHILVEDVNLRSRKHL